MSDTPETDGFYELLEGKCLPLDARYYHMRIHARKIELELHEQCRLLGMSAERECDLLGKLERERALADRLVKVVEHSAKIIGPPDSEHDSRWVTDDELDDLWNRTQSALAAWKEARNE